LTQFTLVGLLPAMDSHKGKPEVRRGLQLLALTFVRPGELRAANWSEIDFGMALWTITGPRMKMRRPHHVPLAAPTIAVLKELEAIAGNSQ
jgi:integrase